MNNEKIIRIAKIIDQSTFIINVGEDFGIFEGDAFSIYDNDGSVINDPDTGEVLGKINSTKGDIYADVVFEKMTLCKTRKINKDNYATMFTNSLLGSRIELNVDLDEVSGLNSKSPVRIGDIVHQKG